MKLLYYSSCKTVKISPKSIKGLKMSDKIEKTHLVLEVSTKAKAKKISLPKWTDVYPQGTKAGDDEQKFFISLARNPKFKWRSVTALVKESGLTHERVEQLLAKYHKRKMVYQNAAAEDQWGYWERHPDLVPDAATSISGQDQKSRINDAKS